MGLITGLLTLPLAPVRGVAWVAEVVAEEADEELRRRESPQRRLAELEAKRATGEISEEEADVLERELIEAALAQPGEEGL